MQKFLPLRAVEMGIQATSEFVGTAVHGATTAAEAVRTVAAASRDIDEEGVLFDGWPLVEPGLVWVPQWRPEDPQNVPEHPEESHFYAGAGRKP